MNILNTKNVAIALAAVVLAGGVILYQNWGCTTIGDLTPEMGSQGYRVWSGPTLKTFSHSGQDICIPEGWQAVGAVTQDEKSAVYERGKTGVLLQKESFGLRTLEPQNSHFRVTVLYPVAMPRAEITRIFSQIDHAFQAVGDLYGDRATSTRVAHTVLVTAGLAGTDAVYPDPTERLTLYIKSPYTERGEALLIHAVTHLYNRFSGERMYLKNQEPFNEAEFQELEATWAETALTTHPDAAFERLNYLYRVHTAMVEQKPELVTEPPFSDHESFMKIRPTILVAPGAPALDVQYGHYVLAPLTMAAIDGLLLERKSTASVATILRSIHLGKHENFMSTLREVLPEKDVKVIGTWITADAQVPFVYVERAIALYDR